MAPQAACFPAGLLLQRTIKVSPPAVRLRLREPVRYARLLFVFALLFWAWKGRWDEAAWALVGVIPFLGDGIRAGQGLLDGTAKMVNAAASAVWAKSTATLTGLAKGAARVAEAGRALRSSVLGAGRTLLSGAGKSLGTTARLGSKAWQRSKAAARAVGNGVKSAAVRTKRAIKGCGKCFVAGTLVLTATGYAAIEDFQVGDRVLTEPFEQASTLEEEPMAEDLRVYHLEAPNPQDPEQPLTITALRTEGWATAMGLVEGEAVDLALPAWGVTGPVTLTAIKPAPELAKGPGQRVITTFRRVDFLPKVALGLEGVAEPVIVTLEHPFYSVERQAWIEAANLQPGERLQTAENRPRSITSVTLLKGSETVYNIEVAQDHNFFVSEAGVLCHNCGDATKGGLKPGDPLPDNAILVMGNNKPGNFILREGLDDRAIGAVTTPGKSATIATDLDMASEFQRMFGRDLKPGDIMSGGFVEDIRAAGFDVIFAPTVKNPNHVRIISNTNTFDDVGTQWLNLATDQLNKVNRKGKIKKP